MKENEIRSRSVHNRYLEIVRMDCERFLHNGDNFVEIDCPACGSGNYSSEFNKTAFEYATCNSCQTLYARLRPSFEKIKQFYTQAPSTSYWINKFFKPVAETRRKKIFRPRAEWVSEYFGADPQWLIGDIGAGFGIFLDELRNLWPNSEFVAIEPSTEQAAICKQLALRVECCALEELQGFENHFDFLTAFELFEHLYDPASFLTSVYRLLKPGGYFLLTTLNGLGFDILVLWEKAKCIYPPCHINFFNPSSLPILLNNCGFVVEELGTPGQLDWDILEGMILNEEFDAGRFWNLVANGRSEYCKKEFQEWLSSNNLSSHMRILSRKVTQPIEKGKNRTIL